VSAEKYQLDASALLALLRDEPGADRVLVCVDVSAIHAVNLIEVFRKMLRNGVPSSEARVVVENLKIPIVADLYPLETAELGSRFPSFSLGDCVCIITAQKTGRVALTTEQAWRGLPSVEVIREPRIN
jgi:ribonuclease VapC